MYTLPKKYNIRNCRAPLLITSAHIFGNSGKLTTQNHVIGWRHVASLMRRVFAQWNKLKPILAPDLADSKTWTPKIYFQKKTVEKELRFRNNVGSYDQGSYDQAAYEGVQFMSSFFRTSYICLLFAACLSRTLFSQFFLWFLEAREGSRLKNRHVTLTDAVWCCQALKFSLLVLQTWIKMYDMW